MTKLDIATAGKPARDSKKWRNKKMSWDDVLDMIEHTRRTGETLKEYFAMPKPEQDSLKDVGAFVGGYLRDGRRLKANVEHRQVLALDVDHGENMDVWLDFDALGITGAMYTTHKHRPEKPRYRLVIPMDRPVSYEEYEAVGRQVAEWLGIDNFDDTTYQANRLMYLPSSSVDGEYLFDEVNGPWLCVDEVLSEMADWRDASTWPRSSRELDRHAEYQRKDKAEDPREKPGVIGAFCRAFTISEVLERFLSDKYDHDEGERWTYKGGSTSGGLIVYDDTFAWSWHSTDPVGDRCVNAFDLVRVHRFGDLDEGKPDKGPTAWPSYRAMMELASELREVKRGMLEQRRESADEFAEMNAREVGASEEWLDRLECEKSGLPKQTIANVVLVFNNDKNLVGRFGFNEYEERETAVSRLPWDPPGTRYPRPLKDSDDAQLRLYLEQVYNLVGKSQITDALTVVLRGNSYHPIKTYLNALEWDGEERLDYLFIDLFGAADDDYTRAVTRKSLVAAVARVYEPGCKYDQMVIIAGDQGVGKSTVLKKLGGDWFSDSLDTLIGKEAQEAIQGSWIIELAELDAMRSAEVRGVKKFVGKQEDRYRVAYGKRVEFFPRRCVFFGTTNESDFLKDVTGNRRFWVINVLGKRGVTTVWEYLTPATVAQIWAEAKHYYKEGEEYAKLPEELEIIAKKIQDDHLEQDDRMGMVEEYLERKLPAGWDDMDTPDRRTWLEDAGNVGKFERPRVCAMEIWAECLGNNPAAMTRGDSFSLGRMLKSLRGWSPYNNSLLCKPYGKQKAWVRDGNYRIT